MASDERDAEIARLQRQVLLQADAPSLVAEVARLTEALAAARAETARVQVLADLRFIEAARLAEALAAAERDRDENARAWASNQRRAEAAEQKLAAAESNVTRMTTERLTVERGWRAAEARVRELEGAVNNECSLRVQATDAAFALESELAQLRERVEKASQLLRLGRSRLVPTAAIVKALEVLGDGQ